MIPKSHTAVYTIQYNTIQYNTIQCNDLFNHARYRLRATSACSKYERAVYVFRMHHRS